MWPQGAAQTNNRPGRLQLGSLTTVMVFALVLLTGLGPGGAPMAWGVTIMMLLIAEAIVVQRTLEREQVTSHDVWMAVGTGCLAGLGLGLGLLGLPGL